MCECLHHHHCVPSWSEVWRVPLARKFVCVGATLCSCNVQPSGPWGCSGNTLLIHTPSPAGISEMGPLARAVRQLGSPSLLCFLQVLKRRGHEGKCVKIQKNGVMVWCFLRTSGQKACGFRIHGSSCDILKWHLRNLRVPQGSLKTNGWMGSRPFLSLSPYSS